MKMQENIALAPYTTFNIGGPARFFCRVTTEQELIEAVDFARKNKLRTLILGGGSNILISDAGFPGLVIKNEIVGISVKQNTDGTSTLSLGAGESWDGIVAYSVERGLYGIENLSAIPGTVGATPVQNIGAYGREIASVLVSLRAYDIKKMKMVELDNKDCEFSYRDSIFKKCKGRYVITSVSLSLRSDGVVDITYRDLKDYFANKQQSAPSLADVRQAVIEIRRKKLPDWKVWGTAGSFFKNPIISARAYAKLKKEYADMPGYPESDGRVKVPLGWILDHVCHIKGHMVGNVGSYENQALVIVTKPGATASEVVARANEIMDMVAKMTGIKVEAEVEWVN